jgi:hypothetical protein
VATKKKVIINPELIAEEVYEDITFTCPKRGVVTQRVKVTKLKPQAPEMRNLIRTGNLLIDEFSGEAISIESIIDEEASYED